MNYEERGGSRKINTESNHDCPVQNSAARNKIAQPGEIKSRSHFEDNSWVTAGIGSEENMGLELGEQHIYLAIGMMGIAVVRFWGRRGQFSLRV